MKKCIAFFVFVSLLCTLLTSCTITDHLLGRSPLKLAEGYVEKDYNATVIYGEEFYEEFDLPRNVRKEDVICYVEVIGDSIGGEFVYCKNARIAEELHTYWGKELPEGFLHKRIGSIVFLGNQEVLDDMP